MGEWYRVVKRIRGTPYVYMQRTHRVPGRKSPVAESYSLGRLDGGGAPSRKKKREAAGGGVSAVARAIFGVENEYGERVDSWWNRHVNKEPKKAEQPEQPEPTKGKPADDAAGKDQADLSSGEA